MRGIDVSPHRVIIVNGTQQALDLICRALINPGDRVLIEEPHYTGARCAFEVSFEHIPSSWNMQQPSVRITGLQF